MSFFCCKSSRGKVKLVQGHAPEGRAVTTLRSKEGEVCVMLAIRAGSHERSW